ncbi:hypothetical protein HWV62_5105 [Athelia sp. TMB]|nr:hypothetical protein HWV62_5105 [Athelia sp. TMB]
MHIKGQQPLPVTLLPVGTAKPKHARSASVSSTLSSKPLDFNARSQSPTSSIASVDMQAPPGLTPPSGWRTQRGPPPPLIIPDVTDRTHGSTRSASIALTSPGTDARHHSRRGASTSNPPSPSLLGAANSMEVRRKRLQKLERLLGETIPPELVVSAGKAKQDTVGELRIPLAQARLDSRTQSWTGEWNREDMQDVQKSLRALKAR